jgi:SAM-dependent methyltransferase
MQSKPVFFNQSFTTENAVHNIAYQSPTGKDDDKRLIFESETYKHIEDSGINSESVVVDIGCGNGEIVCYLLDKVKKIYAIDFSQDQLDLTKSKVDAFVDTFTDTDVKPRLASVRYICADIRNNSNMLLGEIDIVFMRFVMVHNETDKHHQIISNIRQILKPGGIIINEEPVWDSVACSYCPDIDDQYKKTLHDKNMAMESDINTGKFLDKLYTECGFHIKYFEIIDRPTTTYQLKTMHQSTMKIKRSKTIDSYRLAMYDQRDKSMLSISNDNSDIIVLTSGTGYLTACKPNS